MKNNIFKLSILKTIIFNFHYFGFKGVFGCYGLIAKGVQFKSLKGKIILNNKRKGVIKVGFPVLGTENDSTYKGTIDINGNLIIHDSCFFGKGASISIGPDGTIEIGSVEVTGNTKFSCMYNIKIGNDCLISWGGIS